MDQESRPVPRFTGIVQIIRDFSGKIKFHIYILSGLYISSGMIKINYLMYYILGILTYIIIQF